MVTPLLVIAGLIIGTCILHRTLPQYHHWQKEPFSLGTEKRCSQCLQKASRATSHCLGRPINEDDRVKITAGWDFREGKWTRTEEM